MDLQRLQGGGYRVAGSFDREAAEAFAAFCADIGSPGTVELDLAEMEIESGAACAAIVRAVRILLERGGVRLVQPPQVLAHSIYRLGLLPDVELIDPRTDEPTAS